MTTVDLKDRNGNPLVVLFALSSYADEKTEKKQLHRLRVQVRVLGEDTENKEFSSYLPSFTPHIQPREFYVPGYRFRELFPLLASQGIIKQTDATPEMNYQRCHFVEEFVVRYVKQIMGEETKK
jgi:hypothetical protein